jgi:hypothetical protein
MLGSIDIFSDTPDDFGSIGEFAGAASDQYQTVARSYGQPINRQAPERLHG